MKSFILLLFLSNVFIAQTLPKKDKGIAVSYNYSNRHIIDNPHIFNIKPLSYPSVEYKCNYNFRNNFSFKTGVSILAVGHEFSLVTNYRGSPNNDTSFKSFYNAYIRAPLLVSINTRYFYFDIGVSPCVRIVKSETNTRDGYEPLLKATYSCELHLGHYFPIRSNRILLEFASYISEINSNILMNGGGDHAVIYKNTYSQNFQLSIGYMFGKLKSNTELVK